MAVPAQAGGLGGVAGAAGGAAGGVVGGVAGTAGALAGGVKGAVGGIAGGATGAVGGVVGGVAGTTGSLAGGVTNGSAASGLASNGTTSATRQGVLGSAPLSQKALVRLKANILGIRAGVYVLDRYGNLVRVNARIADHILKARANAYVLQRGSLVKVNAKAVLLGLNAKAKVYVLDRHGNVLYGKAVIGLGGLKAKALAKAGTGGIAVKVGISVADRRHRAPGNPDNPGTPGTPGNPGTPGTPSGSIGNEIASLSAGERDQLKKRCVSVLDNPAAYSRDAARVCRVLAQLAGI
ncbi:MAG: hypothetical protein AB7F74_11045 [Parvibaculaceae bacterium]